MLPLRFGRDPDQCATEYHARLRYNARTVLFLDMQLRPLFTLVTDIGPQAIDLGTTDSILIHQDRFYRSGMVCGGAQPLQNRVFFEAFGATDTADAYPLRQQRQSFQDFLSRCLLAVECPLLKVLPHIWQR